MTTDTQTLAEFVAERGITLDVLEGPDFETDRDGWEHYAYAVRLTMDGQHIDMPWKQGLLLTDDPTAETVLDSLGSEAATIEAEDEFEDWAGSLGYDPDSRKAEAIFRQCVAQRDALAQWLGRESYDRLLYGTERL